MADSWNKYGPTAARKHGRPGREVRPKSVTIDIHSHINVPAAAQAMAAHLDPMSIPLLKYASPESGAINRKQEVDRNEVLTSHDQRLRDMDAMGVDVQLVMVAPFQCYYTVPVEHAVKGTQLVNEGLAEFTSKHPDRYRTLGSVTLQDGQQAAKELEACMRQYGFKGVQILTNIAGKELSDPSAAPFWAKAEELGAIVLLHPNGFTEGQRLARHYFNNIIGNPFETTLALHNLIFDGVLERHPNLTIFAVHGGGYLGGYAGRIDHAWGARADCHILPKPPTDYLKKVYVDTVVFTPHQLRALIEVFGPDHVVLGTDYPYDMAEYEPIGHLADTGLDASTMAKIAGGNVAKMLGL